MKELDKKYCILYRVYTNAENAENAENWTFLENHAENAEKSYVFLSPKTSLLKIGTVF